VIRDIKAAEERFRIEETARCRASNQKNHGDASRGRRCGCLRRGRGHGGGRGGLGRCRGRGR
jgi:hypothetical protein